MLDLKTMVEAKQNKSAEWVEKKQQEREGLNDMQRAGADLVTTNPEKYAAFLHAQGNMPQYSAGNTLLVMMQKPEASRVAGMKFWNDQGRNVVAGEKGIKIFAREHYDRTRQVQNINENTGEVSTDIQRQAGYGFKVISVFDVSQTRGRDIAPPTRLTEGSEKMTAAIKGLLDSTKAQMQVDNNLSVPARYEQDVMVIYVKEGCSDNELFRALTEEVAHANLHDGGGFPDYQREDWEFYAKSVSYTLCNQFGVECPQPDFSGVQAEFDGLAHEDRMESLNLMHGLSNDIGYRVGLEVDNMEKQQPAMSKVGKARSNGGAR